MSSVILYLKLKSNNYIRSSSKKQIRNSAYHLIQILYMTLDIIEVECIKVFCDKNNAVFVKFAVFHSNCTQNHFKNLNL